MADEFKTVRITKEAHAALLGVTKRKGRKLNITYALSCAIEKSAKERPDFFLPEMLVDSMVLLNSK